MMRDDESKAKQLLGSVHMVCTEAAANGNKIAAEIAQHASQIMQGYFAKIPNKTVGDIKKFVVDSITELEKNNSGQARELLSQILQCCDHAKLPLSKLRADVKAMLGKTAAETDPAVVNKYLAQMGVGEEHKTKPKPGTFFAKDSTQTPDKGQTLKTKKDSGKKVSDKDPAATDPDVVDAFLKQMDSPRKR